MDMREHGLGYSETMRKHFPHLKERSFEFLKKWERIYLEEGAEGLMKERRGRARKAVGSNKGRPPKLDRKVEEDLIAENQRLRMEIEYLKKRFFIKTGVQKSKERAIKLSIWYNVSDQTNIDRRELWLTYMIPQYTENIKDFIAKRSRKMKKEGTYSDFGAIGKRQKKYVRSCKIYCVNSEKVV